MLAATCDATTTQCECREICGEVHTESSGPETGSTTMPTRMPKRRASRSSLSGPPAPLAHFSSRAALERLAHTRRVSLRTTADDDGALLCPICMHPFRTTGDGSRLFLPTSGHAVHESCAVQCGRNQRARELLARADVVQGDERHTPNTSYICEFGRTPLTPGEVAALFLPPWPSLGDKWLDSEKGHTQTFQILVPMGVGPGDRFPASLSGIATELTVPGGARSGSTIYADVRFRGVATRARAVDVPAGLCHGDSFEVDVDGTRMRVIVSRESIASSITYIPVPQAGAQPSGCDVVRVYTR